MAATTMDIPNRWDPRASQSPTGALTAACESPPCSTPRQAHPSAATTMDIPNRWDPRASQSPTGALTAACESPPCSTPRQAHPSAATTMDIPNRWDPRASQSPTGALTAACEPIGLRHPAATSLVLVSCWPRPQRRLPVSAAGSGRCRCTLFDPASGAPVSSNHDRRS